MREMLQDADDNKHEEDEENLEQELSQPNRVLEFKSLNEALDDLASKALRRLQQLGERDDIAQRQADVQNACNEHKEAVKSHLRQKTLSMIEVGRSLDRLRKKFYGSASLSILSRSACSLVQSTALNPPKQAQNAFRKVVESTHRLQGGTIKKTEPWKMPSQLQNKIRVSEANMRARLLIRTDRLQTGWTATAS